MKQIICNTKFLWGILLGLCYYFGQPYVTLGHAELVDSSPAPGEILDGAPEIIRLEFNEPISPNSTFTIFDQDFVTIPVVVESDQQNPNILIGRNLELTRPAVYTVQWLIFSEDGHTVDGSYTFAVEDRSKGGTLDMELIAAAESTAVNLPGWCAWIMVGLALITPILVKNFVSKK